ncbi:G protein coupled receptor [Fasciola hepatica]|uniref:G protein coupled receptor n=1 Tax=Fasciola hepatica TaxID=6192 RepID=A0A4E0RBU8_FASHE|nr:G protein coupled receptor [Fasciola hepatica]
MVSNNSPLIPFTTEVHGIAESTFPYLDDRLGLGTMSVDCSQAPELTSNGFFEAMNNYVRLCVDEHSRESMLDVLQIELSRLHRHNLLSLHELILLIAVYTAMIVFGSCGSLLVIYVVIRQPRIRTPRNLFIVNLALSDLILCLFTQPFNLLRTLYWHYDWTLGQVMCKAVAMAQAANIFVSTISIIAIALDRLQVIVYPTRHKVHTAGALAIIGSSWLFALLMASPMIAFSSVSQGTIRLDGSVCSPNTLQSHWLRRSKFTYGILTLTFQYCLPITIVSYAYTRIYLLIRRRHLSRHTLRLNEMLSELASGGVPHHGKSVAIQQNNQISQINGNMQITMSANVMGQPNAVCQLEVPEDGRDSQDDRVTRKGTHFPVSTPVMNNPSRIPDREKAIRSRHMRTNALLAAVTITFILAWLPLHTFNLVMDLRELRVASDITALMGVDHESPLSVQPSNQTSDHIIIHLPNRSNVLFNSDQNKPHMTGRISTLIQSFCLFCVLLSACINPVLYGWLNENFHREFKLLCAPCRRSLCLGWKSGVPRTNVRTQIMNEDTNVMNSPQ